MGNWFADDVDLDTCAIFVTDRSAGWTIPARRGDNYHVPGRNGTIRNANKPFDENTLVMQMFAAGANPDGSMPTDESQAAVVKENLTTLSRLFGADRLIEVVHADTPNYGRINRIPNPSMENIGAREVLRENVIHNPSGEFSDGDIVIRRNLLTNPGMEDGTATKAYRTNLVRNPRMASESDPIVLRRNFVLNPGGEVGTRFWREHANVSISTSRRLRVGGTWPIQGDQSVRMTAINNGDSAIEITSIPITVQDSNWTFSAYVWNRAEIPMTYRLSIRWFDHGGAFISASSNVDTVIDIDQIGRIQGSLLTAPLLANTATMRITMIGASADDVAYIDAAMATRSAFATSFFDGDTPETDGLRRRWQDDASRSISEEYYVTPRGWTSPHQLMCTTDKARRGSQAARVQLSTITTTGSVILRQTIPGGSPAAEGDWVVGSIYGQKSDALDGTTRTVKVNLRCYNSQGDDLGLVQDITNVDLPDVTLSLEAGNWQNVTFEAGIARANTSVVVLEVKCGQAWNAGDVVYFDCAMVENAKRVGDWFDGASADDDVFTYIWEGDAHWSISDQTGSNVVGWSVDQGRQYQSTNSHMRRYALQLEPFRTPSSSDRPNVTATPVDVRPGRTHTLSVFANPTRSMPVKIGVSLDGGLSWTYNTPVTLAANVWTRLSQSIVIDLTVNPDDVRVNVTYSGPPADSDALLLDSALFEATSALRPYFDGESGKRFAWTDDPDKSMAVKYGDHANGWDPYGSSRPSCARVLSPVGPPSGTHVVRVTANQPGNIGVTLGQDGIDSELAYSFGISLRASTTLTAQAGIAWYNRKGDLISETLGSSASVGSLPFTRVFIAGATPPTNATVAAPFTLISGAAADDYVDHDAALFGFGGAIDYKDGNSPGWSWKGDINRSESHQLGVAVDYWKCDNGLLSQNNSWSTDRNSNMTYTTTSTGVARFWSIAEGTQDHSRFKIHRGDTTFAIDVHATFDCQVQLRMEMSKWDGQGWVPATGASDQQSEKFPVSSGDTQRLHFTADLSLVNGQGTHFRPYLYLFNAAGNQPSVGSSIRVDSATLSNDDAISYQDGQFQYVIWLGDPDASASKRIGPAQRIWVERNQVVNFSSVGFGTSAAFAVQLTAPKSFWEDTLVKDQTLTIPRAGGTLLLDDFVGATAPIDDSVITITGPLSPFTITDTGSGAWFSYNEHLRDTDTIVIDNEAWTVTSKSGRSRIGNVSYSGATALLPITVTSDDEVPRLQIDADNVGRGATIRVVGVEKYLIA